MQPLRIFLSVVFFAFTLSSCGVSYPKENMEDSLARMVQKETGITPIVFLEGQTFYLDMPLANLTSNDSEKVNEEIKKMQAAVMSIARIVLSSDAKVDFMVVSVFDEGHRVMFRMLQNVRDIKDYYFGRISRGDYESRSLIEIEGPETAAAQISDKHDISRHEYVARLIVSQLNTAARSNPFLGAIISDMRLRYSKVEGDVLVLSGVSEDSDEKVRDLVSRMILDETKKYAQKYSLNFNTVKIINPSGNLIADIKL